MNAAPRPAAPLLPIAPAPASAMPPAACPPTGPMQAGETLMPMTPPFLFETQPARPSVFVWVVVGIGALLLIGGGAWHFLGPVQAVAESKPLDPKSMTARQLAEQADAVAAKELSLRTNSPDAATRMEAMEAVQKYGSPRLERNMMVVAAYDAQRRSAEKMAEVERQIRMAEEDGAAASRASVRPAPPPSARPTPAPTR